MKLFKFWSALLLALALAGGVAAQNLNSVSLLISPREASVGYGEGVKFEAQVFGLNGIIPPGGKYAWKVEPDSLGKITEDGFFIAGRYDGEATIYCEASFGPLAVRLLGKARVVIGRRHDPVIKVIVVPRDEVVPPGTTQKYSFTFVRPSNIPVQDFRVKWLVEPRALGTIDQDGVFTAGQAIGQGSVIAYVETAGALYRGSARVTVAKKPTGIIAGQVVDQQTNLPVFPAHVWAELIGRIEWRVEASVDSATGNYVLRHLIPGLYVVKADARKYLPEFYEEKSHFDEATPVTVAENDSVPDIDFTLSKGGTINGLVGTDGDSSAIAGAHVMAVSAVEPGNPRRWRHAVTNENGEYEITTLPTGSYVLSADAAGYKFEYYDNASGFGQAEPVSLTEPETVSSVDFYLAAGTAILGNVSNSDGDPLNKAAVRILSLNSMRPHYFREVRTDENGDYIADVPPGKYFVRAEARSYLGEYYDDALEFGDADTVTVVENEQAQGIDFVLDPLASISGSVVDAETKAPIFGAAVFAFPELPHSTDPAHRAIEARYPHAAKTDSLGNYVIENVKPGKYYVRAEAQGYLPEFWQEAEELSDADTVLITETTGAEDIDFTLSTGGVISGTVYAAEDSSALQGAVVRVFSATGNVLHRGVSDENGDYRVTGLRTGDYYVHAKADGYEGEFYDDAGDRSTATLVHVDAGDEADGIDFYLDKVSAELGGISGVITSDSTGNPIPHAFVLAVPVNPPGQAFFDLTDQFGFYRVSSLQAGSYIVVAWAPGYVGEFYDDVTKWTEATLVTVAANAETGDINFGLAPTPRGPYHIRGRLRRAGTLAAVANAPIFAINVDGQVVASTVSNVDGSYSLDELPAGDYKIMSSTASAPATFYGGSNQQNASTVDLSSGQNAEDVDITESTTAVEQIDETIPASFNLEQNYPNPFNPETSIKYHLAGQREVSLRVFNMLGQEVATLVNEKQEAGVYRVTWDGSNRFGRKVATGIYMFQLKAGDFQMTRKMVMMK